MSKNRTAQKIMEELYFWAYQECTCQDSDEECWTCRARSALNEAVALLRRAEREILDGPTGIGRPAL